MFSSLSNFQVSSSNQPPLFTNPSIKLFPSDSNVDTFDELHDASPHAPPSSIEDALPVGNTLNNGESSSLPSFISPIGSDPIEPENEFLNPPSSRPTWVRNTPNYLYDYHCFPAITFLHEPQSYEEASSNPLWQQAMQDELQALEKTHTWDLVDLSAGKPLEYGIDYEETFAHVACPTSVCSLIAIAAAKGWKLFQMDVKNAFLNGDLVEEVYMQPPLGLEHPANKV
ncbi:hypothetical protein SLEP1_g25212 [Rubroshorea leprosula]|uniref:Reverse transcriptase Ty1/copia-type domain-containing protein n=1 Tax=Rubroshorea leprosula TaxID=152421 RepID=A0AAV5JSN2_9ROSI|nr:hypothetical protein SLEP1_g25212 [Rubroshorea leprosula]